MFEDQTTCIKKARNGNKLVSVNLPSRLWCLSELFIFDSVDFVKVSLHYVGHVFSRGTYIWSFEVLSKFES